jgi:hypothetical protein
VDETPTATAPLDEAQKPRIGLAALSLCESGSDTVAAVGAGYRIWGGGVVSTRHYEPGRSTPGLRPEHKPASAGSELLLPDRVAEAPRATPDRGSSARSAPRHEQRARRTRCCSRRRKGRP